MAISTPGQAVAALQQLSASGRVELAVSSGKVDARASRSLALDDDARGFFAKAVAGVAAKLDLADELLAYDATYKPEEREFEWAALSDFPQVGLAISALEPLSALPSFRPDDEPFKKELKYAATVLRDGSQSAYLFRSFTRTHELSEKKRITLTLRDGRFGRPEDRLFQFDEDADAVVVDEVLIVVHKPAFRRLFQALAAVFAEAQTAADAVHQKVPIKNLDAFKTAVGRDANLADKVIAVTRRPYFGQLDIDAIEQTNNAFNLGVPITVVNGKKVLEFRTGPRERWKLLKLLDDDHLTSTMTSSKYSVNSKRPS